MMTNVSEAVSAVLKSAGIRTMYGVLGDGNLELVEDFVAVDGRYLAACHEMAAVMMAYGHALATRSVGLATTTHGPGLTHAVTGLVEAVRGQVPMVVLCGSPASSGHPQYIDQARLVGATGAHYVSIATPARAAAEVSAALQYASAKRTPVVVDIPVAVQTQWTEQPELPTPEKGRVPTRQPSPPATNSVDFSLVANSERPIVVVGRGAVESRDELLTLARHLGAPIGTTLRAVGLYSGLREDVGVLGSLAPDWVQDLMTHSDCVVAAGASLNRYTTAGGLLTEGKPVVSILNEQVSLAAGFSKCVGTQEDHLAEVASFLSRTPGRSYWPKGSKRVFEKQSTRDRRVDTVDLGVALGKITDALPADHLYVSDGGRFMVESLALVRVNSPHHFLFPQSFASIGTSVSTAVGAANSSPERTVLVVCGDGGFMHGGLPELATAARLGLRIAVVVCNDGGYGAEYVQFKRRGSDSALAMFDWPDLASVAESLGARGLNVVDDASLDAACRLLENGPFPLLINLHVDPDAIGAMP